MGHLHRQRATDVGAALDVRVGIGPIVRTCFRSRAVPVTGIARVPAARMAAALLLLLVRGAGVHRDPRGAFVERPRGGRTRRLLLQIGRWWMDASLAPAQVERHPDLQAVPFPYRGHQHSHASRTRPRVPGRLGVLLGCRPFGRLPPPSAAPPPPSPPTPAPAPTTVATAAATATATATVVAAVAVVAVAAVATTAVAATVISTAAAIAAARVASPTTAFPTTFATVSQS